MLVELLNDGRLRAGAIESAKTLIRHFEGLRLHAYYCPGGVETIGYGHTADGEWQQTKVVTEDEAEMYLTDDIMSAWNAVKRDIEIALNSGEQAAVVSYVFNLGAKAFRGSTLLRCINAGDRAGAEREFSRWIYAGGKVLKGLQRRRHAEALVWSGYRPDTAIELAEEEFP